MNDTITISRTEYDALLEAREDLEDIRAYGKAVAALERGDEESIPSEFANRMIDGEHPVRVFRDWRGLSASELARRSAIHRVQIYDIETGKKSGSIATLKALANALGVTVDDLI